MQNQQQLEQIQHDAERNAEEWIKSRLYGSKDNERVKRLFIKKALEEAEGKQMEQIRRDAEEWVNRHPYGFKGNKRVQRHFIKAAKKEAKEKQLEQIRRDAEETWKKQIRNDAEGWIGRHPYEVTDIERAKRFFIKFALDEAVRR